VRASGARGIDLRHSEADAGPGKLPRPLSEEAEAFGLSLGPAAVAPGWPASRCVPSSRDGRGSNSKKENDHD